MNNHFINNLINFSDFCLIKVETEKKPYQHEDIPK